MSISRGPYESVRGDGDELRKVARMDGRGIMFCRKRTSDKRAVMMCNGVASLALRGESDIDHGVDCAYTAVIGCWHGNTQRHQEPIGSRGTPHTRSNCANRNHTTLSARLPQIVT